MTTELPLGKEAFLKSLEFKLQAIPAEQLRVECLNLATQLFVQEQHFRELLKHNWGIDECPYNTAIADEALELELLRSHRSAANMLLESLTDIGTTEKMAAAARTAFVHDLVQNCPDMASEFASYHNLSEAAKDSLRGMVRAALSVLLNDFPVANMRNVDVELAKLRGQNDGI